ncbi:MAG: substrate-binding domain-containing protein [Verrucomicrobiae bacterium]|nr:substrate-binding domain-containing protein [Verrucomicrobiae bacterium]NNJ85567.1 substrate-binding domain-containing protein [Akkermansiaceae bacterium]
MDPIRILTASEQVAQALRNQLLRGKWSGMMPGVYQLAEELGVSRRLVEGALSLLEKEGLLVSQGKGKPRKIVAPEEPSPGAVKIKILLYENEDRDAVLFQKLQHMLLQAGYVSSFASKTLLDLDMDVQRLERFVEKADADAWVVVAGSSAVLQWFSDNPLPAFAWFGRAASNSIKLAHTSPVKNPAQTKAVDRLVGLGHSRIVMLAREERRKPVLGALERMFLNDLEKHGIATSSYNLPDWDNNREAFHRCLDSLFQVSPPTALIISEAALFWAALQQLAERNIVAPRDISLMCLDPDPTFTWTRPRIAHIDWDTQPMLRHILRWADHIRRGKDYRRKRTIKARFHQGGTLGPVPDR